LRALPACWTRGRERAVPPAGRRPQAGGWAAQIRSWRGSGTPGAAGALAQRPRGARRTVPGVAGCGRGREFEDVRSGDNGGAPGFGDSRTKGTKVGRTHARATGGLCRRDRRGPPKAVRRSARQRLSAAGASRPTREREERLGARARGRSRRQHRGGGLQGAVAPAGRRLQPRKGAPGQARRQNDPARRLRRAWMRRRTVNARNASGAAMNNRQGQGAVQATS